MYEKMSISFLKYKVKVYINVIHPNMPTGDWINKIWSIHTMG